MKTLSWWFVRRQSPRRSLSTRILLTPRGFVIQSALRQDSTASGGVWPWLGLPPRFPPARCMHPLRVAQRADDVERERGVAGELRRRSLGGPTASYSERQARVARSPTPSVLDRGSERAPRFQTARSHSVEGRVSRAVR